VVYNYVIEENKIIIHNGHHNIPQMIFPLSLSSLWTSSFLPFYFSNKTKC